MTNVRDLFALPWMVGRSDVVAWWVTGGHWGLGGGITLFLAAIATTGVYSHLRRPTGRPWVTLAFVVMALSCLVLAGRGRVELRANDLRVESEDWGRPAAVYRAEQAARLNVSCETGRRSKIYPAFDVTFSDGAYMDLTPLVTSHGNSFGRRDALRMAERLDDLLSARGNRYASYLENACVRRVARQLGGDAPRLERLFRAR